MSKNYVIHENIIDNIAANDPKLAEKLIINQMINQVKAEENSRKHEVKRPDISVRKDIIILVISAIVAMLLIIVISNFIKNPFGLLLIVTFTLLAWNFMCLKKFIITMIILYQKYAPEEVRASCMFEPSCSEYMKLAVEKYGIFKGVVKGIKRINRCHYPNSGIDEP